MQLGFDLSNYSGEPSASTLLALRNRYQLTRAILACEFSDVYAMQAEACAAAGIPFEAYLYLYNNRGDYQTQLDGVTVQLAAYPPGRLWLDFEDEGPPLPSGDQLKAALMHAAERYETGIYTSAGYWQRVGEPDLSRLAPLWLARWTDRPPDLLSGYDAGFGGWVRAAVVQYAGNITLEGVALDLDAWSSG